VTAATAPSDLLPGEPGLVESLVERLSEAELVELLVCRFRVFVRAGHSPEDAALLAVGRDPSPRGA
jgi:hypothetical protein